MSEWMIIIFSLLVPMILMPIVLPTLVLVAKRKHITDVPNYRKFQRKPVSVMGGMVVVCVIASTMACASLFVDLNALFPAICMMVVLMTLGVIDDILNINYLIKLIVQSLVVGVLFFVGHYRITSLYGVFGIYELNIWVSCIISILIGVAIINAINFIDGIDGLVAVVGLLVSIAMTVWCLHHDVMPHAVFSLIITGSLAAFLIFNAFSDKFKMYMGDSGTLVLGLFVYLSVCEIMSHNDFQLHLSDGYEASFAMVMIAIPIFDFFRVCILRIVRGQSPVHPDRTHIHHFYVDMGFSHLTVCLILFIANFIIYPIWGLFVELHCSPTIVFLVTMAACIMFINGPYFFFTHLAKRKPDTYHRLQVRIRCRRLFYYRRHNKVTQWVDTFPTLWIKNSEE